MPRLRLTGSRRNIPPVFWTDLADLPQAPACVINNPGDPVDADTYVHTEAGTQFYYLPGRRWELQTYQEQTPASSTENAYVLEHAVDFRGDAYSEPFDESGVTYIVRAENWNGDQIPTALPPENPDDPCQIERRLVRLHGDIENVDVELGVVTSQWISDDPGAAGIRNEMADLANCISREGGEPNDVFHFYFNSMNTPIDPDTVDEILFYSSLGPF